MRNAFRKRERKGTWRVIEGEGLLEVETLWKNGYERI